MGTEYQLVDGKSKTWFELAQIRQQVEFDTFVMRPAACAMGVLFAIVSMSLWRKLMTRLWLARQPKDSGGPFRGTP